MYYRQLKDFFRQREQKAFWIFNYANIVGLFAGLFVARFLAEQMSWLPGLILFPATMFAGLACTWPRQGRETYKTWWLWGGYLVRRVFASGSLVLTSNEYYRSEQVGLAIRPFAVAGRMAYLGDRAFTNGATLLASTQVSTVTLATPDASIATTTPSAHTVDLEGA